MTQSQIEQLATLLRRKMPKVPAVEGMIADDIKVIAPFVDDLVDQARQESRFATYLEFINGYLRNASKFNRRAMDETPTPF